MCNGLAEAVLIDTMPMDLVSEQAGNRVAHKGKKKKNKVLMSPAGCSLCECLRGLRLRAAARTWMLVAAALRVGGCNICC